LHYAADGRRNPSEQQAIITYLVQQGADPNALDNSGVAPIHRAVRTRSSYAVKALIEQGADPRLPNKAGSTPLHLAVQNTGASHSGSDVAKEEQARIITLLLDHGASPKDTDAKGKTVAEAASSDWVRDLLEA
jgi:ankyrin repeat protein